MQAILTTYRGPTATRGARIYARANAGATSIAYPHDAPSLDMAPHQAALALIKRLNWSHLLSKYTLAQGGLPNDKGEAFIFVQR